VHHGVQHAHASTPRTVNAQQRLGRTHRKDATGSRRIRYPHRTADKRRPGGHTEWRAEVKQCRLLSARESCRRG
jgi:hypothetical protein